jgi:hypothetical protein
MRMYSELDRRERETCRVKFDDVHIIPFIQLFATGIAGSTNLKRLSLNLWAHRAWDVPAEHPLSVDLELLEALDVPNLQSLALTVQLYDSFRTNPRVKAAMRESASRLGKALVGIEGKETLVEIEDETNVRWNMVFTRR